MRDLTKLPMNLQIFAGEEGQEPADPVLEGDATGGEVVDEPAEPEGGEVQDPAEPAIDENARFAAARRQAEAQIAARDQRFAERFGHITNPVTGRPIQSEKDYFEALDYQAQQQVMQQAKDQGVNPELIEQLVANSPAMRQAQQVIRQATIDEGNREMNQQIQEISGFYPEVKTLDDIVKMETFPVFDAYVRQGLNLVDAFRLANFDALSQRGAAASKQAAINAAKGKGHLSPVGGGAGDLTGEVEIPANERELWESFYPGLSYKELRTKYNNTL